MVTGWGGCGAGGWGGAGVAGEDEDAPAGELSAEGLWPPGDAEEEEEEEARMESRRAEGGAGRRGDRPEAVTHVRCGPASSGAGLHAGLPPPAPELTWPWLPVWVRAPALQADAARPLLLVLHGPAAGKVAAWPRTLGAGDQHGRSCTASRWVP